MWQITPQNAPFVIVASASAIACALGSLTAHLITKRVLNAKYEDLITQEIEEARRYYSMRNKAGDFSDPVKAAEKLIHDKYDEKVSMYKSDTGHISTDNAGTVRDEVRHHASKPEPEEDMETFEQRLIDEAKEEVEDVKHRLGIFDEEDNSIETEEELITMNVFSENESDSAIERRGPSTVYIISSREFEHGDNDYSQNTLTYFEGDDVLVDERDKPIHNKSNVIGDVGNLSFGDQSNDPNVVYIRNEHLEVDFEVCRSSGTFTEEILGISIAEDRVKNRPRKFRTDD